MFRRSRALTVISTSALILAALVATQGTAQAETVLDDDFESGVSGDPPAGWSITDNGGTVALSNVATSENPDNLAMCMTRDTVNQGLLAGHDVDPVSGQVTIELTLRANQTDALFYGPTLRDSQGSVAMQFGLHHETGQFSALTSAWTGYAPYTANTWHHVRIEADTDTDTFDLYWDGTQVADAEPFQHTVDDIANIRFNSYTWTTGTTCYDDIEISAPDPSAVLDDDFETGVSGDPPAGWSITDNGGTVALSNVATSENPDNLAMCMTRDTVNQGLHAGHAVDPVSGQVTIELTLRANQTDALFYGPTLRDSQGSVAMQFGLHHETGQFSALTSAWTGYAPYTANTWHHVRIEADTDTDTFDLYWDGTQVADAEPFQHTVDDIANIRFNSYTWTTGTTCYDDIVIASGHGGGLPPDDETFLDQGGLLDEMSNGVFAPLRHTSGIDLNGSFDQWRQFTGVSLPANDDQIEIDTWGGDADASADAYFAYDEESFYLGLEVTDDVHNGELPDNWRGDSIQFSFGDTVFPSFRSEYGVALVDGAVDIQRYSDGLATSSPDSVEAVITRDEAADLTTYAMRIPWTSVMGDTPTLGALTRFTFLINDNDGSGREGYLEWTPGIGAGKDVNAHAQIELLDPASPWTAWLAGPSVVDAGTELQLALLAPNFGAGPLDLSVDVPAAQIENHQVTVPAGQAVKLSFTIAVDQSVDVVATIDDGGQVREPSHHVDALLSGTQILAMLDDIENNVLPDLQALLGQANAAGHATDYETVNVDTIEMFIPFGRQDVANDRRDRGQYIAETLYDLAAEAEAALTSYLDGGASPLVAPRYVTGATQVDGYRWLGTTTEGPNEPVFFSGYGMFGTVLNDIPKFPGLGTNIVDHVFGPNEVIAPPGESAIPGWNRSRTGSASIELVNNVSHGGTQSVRFTNLSGLNSLVQSVPVTPGQTYTFSAWVKGEDALSPRVISKSWTFQHFLPTGTYDWTQVTFDVPAEAFENLEFRLFQEETGTVWLDDASITLAGTSGNLLTNGDFEDGEPGDGDLYSINMSAINNKLLPALDEAAANDIAVNLTLAPHRWPSWTHSAYPDIRNNGALFSYRNFDPENPLAQEMITAFIDATMAAVGDHPALVSVTVGSEPNYLANTGDYHLANWRAHAEQMYGTIGAANSRWGTAYASFDDLPVPDMAAVTGSPLYYDYLTFKEGKFLEHHQLMRDAVHAQAPGIPTHIKIMGWGAGNRNALRDWAVDVEAFSELTEISGNDNGTAQQEGPAGYRKAMLLLDSQRSFAEKPVFNSENHVISDGDERYIPQIAGSVENQLWLEALHGQVASAIWLWDRSYNVELHPYMQGSILNRPDAIANVGRVTLDLNRLNDEVMAFVEEPPDVAILYSRVPLLYSGQYWSAVNRAYNAMSATGQHVGFVSDDQIAAGGLGDYQLVVVPEVSNLPAATLTGIRNWQTAGGRVVTIGDPATLLTGDEYDDPLPAAVRDALLAGATQVPSGTAQPDLTGIFFNELSGLGLNHVIAYDVATGEPATDLEWRIADNNGQTLVSIVNLSEDDRQITVEVDGSAVTPTRELISDTAPGSGTLAIDSLGHYLYELP